MKFIVLEEWTDSMEPSPWEGNSYLATQEIPKVPKVHYHVHKDLPLDPILSQMNPVYLLQLVASHAYPYQKSVSI
jgi:hypothetical protein